MKIPDFPRPKAGLQLGRTQSGRRAGAVCKLVWWHNYLGIMIFLSKTKVYDVFECSIAGIPMKTPRTGSTVANPDKSHVKIPNTENHRFSCWRLRCRNFIDFNLIWGNFGEFWQFWCSKMFSNDFSDSKHAYARLHKCGSNYECNTTRKSAEMDPNP